VLHGIVEKGFSLSRESKALDGLEIPSGLASGDQEHFAVRELNSKVKGVRRLNAA
jgi:hypothetical protein